MQPAQSGARSTPLEEQLRGYFERNGVDTMSHPVQYAQYVKQIASKYAHQEDVLWRKLRAKYGDVQAQTPRNLQTNPVSDATVLPVPQSEAPTVAITERSYCGASAAESQEALTTLP